MGPDIIILNAYYTTHEYTDYGIVGLMLSTHHLACSSHREEG